MSLTKRQRLENIRDAAIECLKECEPERPEPKIKPGSWFIWYDSSDKCRVDEQEPSYIEDYGWLYPTTDLFGGQSHEYERFLLNKSYYLPIPPKPDPVPDGRELTGECRAPEAGESWASISGCMVIQHGNIDALDMVAYGGRRWIIKPKLAKWSGTEKWFGVMVGGWAGDKQDLLVATFFNKRHAEKWASADGFYPGRYRIVPVDPPKPRG